jgi:signal transduction histidine kinase
LYRIALEALANIRKHARATRVTVELEGRDDEYVLLIVDDGLGFRKEPDTVTNGPFGLHGIRERARLLGGRVPVRTAPGAGTVLEIWIPRTGSGESRAPRERA